MLLSLFPPTVKSWFQTVFFTNPPSALWDRISGSSCLQKPPGTAAGGSGYWKWDPAGDLCTMSDQIRCRSLVMLQNCYSYSSSLQDWILLFRSLFPLPAFLLLFGLICGWSWQGTVILLSCGPVLFSPRCSLTALSVQAIPGGFISVVLCYEKSQMFAWKQSLIYCWRLCSLYPQNSLKILFNCYKLFILPGNLLEEQ